MKKVIRTGIIILLCFAAFFNRVNAQPVLKVAQLIGFPDTACFGSPGYSFSVSISNTGNTTFADDTLLVLLESDTTPISPDTLYFFQLFSIAVNDTDTVSVFNHNFVPAHFIPGNNTVVVWPSAPGILVDTLNGTELYLNCYSRIEDIPEQSIVIYPNPVSNYIEITSVKKPEQVRIMDVTGREILFIRNPLPKIQMEDLPPGLYIMEVILKENKRAIVKLIKQ